MLEPVKFNACLLSFAAARCAATRRKAAAASPPPAGGVQLGPGGRCRRALRGLPSTAWTGPRSSGGGDRRNREQVRGLGSTGRSLQRSAGDRRAEHEADVPGRQRQSSENGSSTSNTRRSAASRRGPGRSTVCEPGDEVAPAPHVEQGRNPRWNTTPRPWRKPGAMCAGNGSSTSFLGSGLPCASAAVIDMTDDSSSIWFYWPMFGSGIAVAITGIVLLGIGGLFGIEWERREIDKYLRRRGNERGP
jgi:2TM domain